MGKKPTKKITPKQTQPSQLIYQMKVSLIGIKPPIWRTIQVTGDTTLEIFDDIIQISMGWFGEHIYSSKSTGYIMVTFRSYRKRIL